MKRIGKIVIGISLAVGLIGGGVWYAQQRAAQNPETRFKLATLEKGDVTQTVSANGTLTPLVLVNVGTQVSGTVRKLYVDFNAKVKAGQEKVKQLNERFADWYYIISDDTYKKIHLGRKDIIKAKPVDTKDVGNLKDLQQGLEAPAVP